MAWNQPTVGKNDKPIDVRSKVGLSWPLLRGLVAGSFVIAVGLFVAFYLFSGKEVQGERFLEGSKGGQIEEVRPSTNSVKRTTASPRPVVDVGRNDLQKKTYYGRVIVSEEVTTNGPVVVTKRVTDKGQVLTSARNIQPTPIFKAPTDTLIAMTLNAQATKSMPPLPPSSPNADEEFLKSLETPIVVLEDDPEDVRAMKLAVRAARLQIKVAMDNGEHFNDIIQEQWNLHNQAVDLHSDASSSYRDILREGDSAMAEEYRKKANALLEGQGVEPVQEYRDRKTARGLQYSRQNKQEDEQ